MNQIITQIHMTKIKDNNTAYSFRVLCGDD